MTLDRALDEGAARLARQGIDTARLDAELLLAKALRLTRVDLYLDRGRSLSGEELAEYRGLIARRGRREPLAYILGEWGFRRLTLKVDRRVLVPRPETEIVVERCLELLRGLESPAVLDVGTGSGAIALAIADEHPGARVSAVDVSEEALEVARENAAATGLAVAFEQRDLREGLGDLCEGPGGGYDLVVSNPPYVHAEEIEGLEPEVRDWEPRTATVGGEHTELVARAARDVLRPAGWLVLEVAGHRGDETARLVQELGYVEVRVSPDLTGRDRVVEGRWDRSRRQ